MRIHWCGTGLSSRPGLRRLIQAGHPVSVWNLPVDQAVEAVGDLTDDIHEMLPGALESALRPRDIVVSMLPASMHALLAQSCVERSAHFVSSSYISPEMRALDEPAREAGVVVLNEVGLDPGIDHLMAHDLVAAYRATGGHRPGDALSFTSYCGGLPAVTNGFRYKFSWSPLGVLRALQSPARSIRDYSELRVARPWDAIRTFIAPLRKSETFEVYPNRDSLPFIDEYRFDPNWKIKEFVRGTLRLNGWAEAWSDVFEELSSGADDARLTEISDALWKKYALPKDEPDRVVLCVTLKSERDGALIWQRSWVLDAEGDVRGSAMARLVSGTVSLGVEAIMAREIPVGVHAAPHDPRLVKRWLDEIGHLAQHMRLIGER